MRRLLFVGFAAAVLAATAAAQTNRADTRGLCNTNSVDIYYWPQGHPAIPAIGLVRLSLRGGQLVLSQRKAGMLATVDTTSFAVRAFHRPEAPSIQG